MAGSGSSVRRAGVAVLMHPTVLPRCPNRGGCGAVTGHRRDRREQMPVIRVFQLGGGVVFVADNVEQVQERVHRMRVVSRKGLERVLPVQEDDGVLARPEEVLGRGGAARAGGGGGGGEGAVRAGAVGLSGPGGWLGEEAGAVRARTLALSGQRRCMGKVGSDN